jgi:hypothetical protein
MLDVNNCIKGLSPLFSRTLKEKITLQVFLGDDELPVTGDPAQIAAIFAILVECCSRLAPGGSMMILTALLPLDIGLAPKRTGKGCAFLSFCAVGRGGEQISSLSDSGRDGVLRALSDVRDIVEGHHGCFRQCLREAGIDFKVYLPVARGITADHRAGNGKAAFRWQEVL